MYITVISFPQDVGSSLTRGQNIPEDGNLHTYRRENTKSHICHCFLSLSANLASTLTSEKRKSDITLVTTFLYPSNSAGRSTVLLFYDDLGSCVEGKNWRQVMTIAVAGWLVRMFMFLSLNYWVDCRRRDSIPGVGRGFSLHNSVQLTLVSIQLAIWTIWVVRYVGIVNLIIFGLMLLKWNSTRDIKSVTACPSPTL